MEGRIDDDATARAAERGARAIALRYIVKVVILLSSCDGLI